MSLRYKMTRAFSGGRSTLPVLEETGLPHTCDSIVEPPIVWQHRWWIQMVCSYQWINASNTLVDAYKLSMAGSPVQAFAQYWPHWSASCNALSQPA
jgi:hypothetical protein